MQKGTVLAIAAALLEASCGVAQTSIPSATAAEAQVFDVSLVIRDGARIVSEPRLRVAAGAPGRIVIEPGDGSHYRLDFSVIGISNAMVDFSSAIDVQSAGDTKFSRMQASPRLTLRAGEAGRIMLGDERHGVGPFTTDIIIRSVGS
jgi:hypothetical protein